VAVIAEFESSVFINCPFDDHYAPLLEALVFCVVYAGLKPRLASESLEAGQNRLDKIFQLIGSCRYSIHDLSLCRASAVGEYFRMNMPFELGLDLGYRKSNVQNGAQKKFLIFEAEPYDLKKALSDIAGQDVAFHRGNFQLVMKSVRDFLRVEAEVQLPGAAKLESDYATFQGWMTEKKIHEGHSEHEALRIPTRERIDEMVAWVGLGKPIQFVPV